MTTVGCIGSGNIGGTVARLSVAAGYDVVLSNSRGPEALRDLVREIGPRARAASVRDAVASGDLVVVTIPFKTYTTVPAEPLAGKVVVDTGNYYPARDGQIAPLDDRNETSSGRIQRHLSDPTDSWRRSSVRPGDTRPRPSASRLEILRRRLIDPSADDDRTGAGSGGRTSTMPLSSVPPERTLAAADCFVSQRTSAAPSVAAAYEQLERQTDRQFAVLTAAQGRYRFRVVSTSGACPYNDAAELIASVLETRTLEVTTARADRDHPMLGGAVGGPYFRFRAVHDLVGHVATGYGFDPDGEYSAWLVQSSLYQGGARLAAATELHGEISALWATGQYAEHRAVLLEPELIAPGLAQGGG